MRGVQSRPGSMLWVYRTPTGQGGEQSAPRDCIGLGHSESSHRTNTAPPQTGNIKPRSPRSRRERNRWWRPAGSRPVLAERIVGFGSDHKLPSVSNWGRHLMARGSCHVTAKPRTRTISVRQLASTEAGEDSFPTISLRALVNEVTSRTTKGVEINVS